MRTPKTLLAGIMVLKHKQEGDSTVMIDKERHTSWSENATGMTLLCIAVLGILYELVHILWGEAFVERTGGGEGALILLVSLMCGALGLERLFVVSRTLIVHKSAARIEEVGEDIRSLLSALARFESKVETNDLEISRRINAVNKAEPLIGSKEIEEAALEIIEKAGDDDDINATNQYGREGLSKNYVKAIADRVKKADANGGDMEYRVIMPVRTDSDAGLEDVRRKVFTEQEIETRLIEKHARYPYPLEVLIVGHSMIIALRGGRNRPTYEVAIKITDPQFVEKAANWFKEVAWLDAENDPKTSK